MLHERVTQNPCEDAPGRHNGASKESPTQSATILPQVLDDTLIRVGYPRVCLTQARRPPFMAHSRYRSALEFQLLCHALRKISTLDQDIESDHRFQKCSTLLSQQYALLLPPGSVFPPTARTCSRRQPSCVNQTVKIRREKRRLGRNLILAPRFIDVGAQGNSLHLESSTFLKKFFHNRKSFCVSPSRRAREHLFFSCVRAR